MAISAAEVAQASPTQPGEQGKVRPGDVVVRRNLTIIEGGGGMRVENGRLQGPEDNQEGVVPAEVVIGYRTTFDNYIRNLYRVKTKDATILNGAAHAHERLFLEKFLGENGVLNEDALNKFVSSQEGLDTITQVIEEQTANKIYAAGILYEAKPDLLRTLPPGANETIFRRMFQLIRPKRAAVPYFGRTGFNAEAFNVIKNDTDKAQYMREMYGFDVADFRVNATSNTIEAAPGHFPESAIDVSTLLSSAEQGMHLRTLYLNKAFGIPVEKIDTLPEEILWKQDPLDEHPEQIGLTWYRDIVDEWKPNDAGTPGYIDGDLEGNAKRFNEARAKVMAKKTKEYMQRQLQRQDKDLPDTLRRKAERLKSPIEEDRRTQEATQRKKRLSEEQKEVGEQVLRFETYDAYARELRAMREMLASDLNVPVADNAPISDILTAISTASDDIDKDLRKTGGTGAKDNLDKLTGEKAQKIADLTGEIIKKQTDGKTFKGGIPPEMLTSAQQLATTIASAQYDSQIEPYQQSVSELTTKKGQLRALQGQFRDKSRQITNEEREVLLNAPKEVSAFITAREKLTNPPGASPTITDTELRTLNVPELIALVRASGVYATIPQTTQAEVQELYAMLVRAKAESKALEEEADNISPQSQTDAFSNITTVAGGISFEDLLRKNDQELRRILTADPVYAPLRGASGFDANNVLSAAKAEALKKQRIRYRSYLDERDKDLKVQIDLQERIIKNAGNIEANIRMVATTQEATRNISEKLYQAEFIVAEPQRYLSTEPVTASDTSYSEAERSAAGAQGYAKGYYELLNIIFDYQQQPDRNEFFMRIQELPATQPDELAKLMNATLSLGISPRRLTYDNVLKKIKTKISDGTIAAPEMNRMLRTTITRLHDEAMAI